MIPTLEMPTEEEEMGSRMGNLRGGEGWSGDREGAEKDIQVKRKHNRTLQQ